MCLHMNMFFARNAVVEPGLPFGAGIGDGQSQTFSGWLPVFNLCSGGSLLYFHLLKNLFFFF